VNRSPTQYHLEAVSWALTPLFLHREQIDVALFRAIKAVGCGAQQAVITGLKRLPATWTPPHHDALIWSANQLIVL
jgi:hypothetical protein